MSLTHGRGQYHIWRQRDCQWGSIYISDYRPIPARTEANISMNWKWCHLSKIFECKIVIFFLSISLIMCFGCSKEQSQWVSLKGSFEYTQHMFWLRNKKNIFQLHTLIWGFDELKMGHLSQIRSTCDIYTHLLFPILVTQTKILAFSCQYVYNTYWPKALY